ncbi:MAG TPA: MgtC/SapB family protein [Armatimonadota bacterium]|nr:MgtC/SapB family protein [Armatimonadota bacterium]
MDFFFLDLVFKLLLSIGAGGLVGLEREQRDRPAGLRTHVLVCVGSALITLISVNLWAQDQTRIAANIVTGIGFLGAGTIFRSGNGVRGLTTAAGIWVVAGIGMGIAAGGTLMSVSLVTAVLVYAINRWLRVVEDTMLRTYRDLILDLSRAHSPLPQILEELDRRRVRIENLEWLEELSTPTEAVVRLRLRLPSSLSLPELTAWLSAQEGLRQVSWD